LRSFTKERTVNLLKCSHVICEACWDFTVKLECPIHIGTVLDFIGNLSTISIHLVFLFLFDYSVTFFNCVFGMRIY
jgi:hypothetical protein